MSDNIAYLASTVQMAEDAQRFRYLVSIAGDDLMYCAKALSECGQDLNKWREVMDNLMCSDPRGIR